MLAFWSWRGVSDECSARVFSESFKRDAVDRAANSELSAGAVARELGLQETVLPRWMTQFGMQATGASRRPTTQASSPSPSDLAAEVAGATAGERATGDEAGTKGRRRSSHIQKKAALTFGAASR